MHRSWRTPQPPALNKHSKVCARSMIDHWKMGLTYQFIVDILILPDEWQRTPEEIGEPECVKRKRGNILHASFLRSRLCRIRPRLGLILFFDTFVFETDHILR